MRFEAPIWGAELHPYNHQIFVVSLFDDAPTLVDFTDGTIRKHLLNDISSTKTSADNEETFGSPSPETQNDGVQEKQSTLVATFTRSGQHIFTGTSKGWLNIIDSENFQTVRSERITTSNIKHISFSISGKQFLINSSDRTIRLFNTPDLTYVDPSNWMIDIVHRFQDVVNRLQWNSIAFSSNGDYVMASTYQDQHDIYIWETAVGSLVKIIEAPREEIVDVQWHPNRTLIAATGLDKGNIYVWATVTPQQWSALAPDFVEVDENVEYEEKEDEFDVVCSKNLAITKKGQKMSTNCLCRFRMRLPIKDDLIKKMKMMSTWLQSNEYEENLAKSLLLFQSFLRKTRRHLTIPIVTK